MRYLSLGSRGEYHSCVALYGFQGRATDVIARIKEIQEALRRATRHVLTRAAKCINLDGGIFENIL
jgi:hypothetical protein